MRVRRRGTRVISVVKTKAPRAIVFTRRTVSGSRASMKEHGQTYGHVGPSSAVFCSLQHSCLDSH